MIKTKEKPNKGHTYKLVNGDFIYVDVQKETKLRHEGNTNQYLLDRK